MQENLLEETFKRESQKLVGKKESSKQSSSLNKYIKNDEETTQS